MPDQQNLDDLYGMVAPQPEPQGLLARHFWKKHTAETNAHNMVIREIAAAAHDPQLQSPEAAHLLNSTLYSLSGKKPSDNAKFLQEGKLQQILDQAGQMEKQAREQSKKAAPAASTSLSSQPINLGGANYGRFAAPQPPPDAFGQQSAPAQQVAPEEFVPPAPPPSALGEGVGLGSVRTDFNRSQLGRQAFFSDPLIAQLPVEEQINAFNKQYIGPRGSQSGAAATPYRVEFGKDGQPYIIDQSSGKLTKGEGFTPPSPPPMEISPGASLYDPTTKTFTGTAPGRPASEGAKSYEELAYQDWIARPENKGKGRDQFRVFQNKAMDNPSTPKSEMVYVPDGRGGFTATEMRAGQHAPPGTITRTGMNSMNVPTSVTRTMIESAEPVKSLANQVAAAINRAEQKLGPIKGRWSDIWVGKVGATDPDIKKLRTDVALLTTRLMRMHVGGRGGEAMMEHFKELLNTSRDSPENLRAALSEIVQYADATAAEGRAAGMNVGNPSSVGPPPSRIKIISVK